MNETTTPGVSWRTLLWSALGLFSLMTTLAAGAGYWAWQNLVAQVALNDQAALVRLPSELAVRASVTNKVQVRVDQTLRVRVPVHETLMIPIKEAIPLMVNLDTSIPIDLDVPIQQTLHVDQVFDLDTQVQTKILGIPITVPVQGKVPVKADVPINLVIPVRKQLPISLSAPASIRLLEPLQAQVDTVLDTQVPIRGSFDLPVTSAVNAQLTFPSQTVEAGLSKMNIALPLDAVHLGLKKGQHP